MKNNHGITMIALVITIVILIILAGISIGEGSKTIERSGIENLKTNMLLIKAKAKVCVESANFKLGTSLDSLSEEDKTNRINTAKQELIGEEVTNIDELNSNIGVEETLEENNQNYIYYYKLSVDNLENMGIKQVKSDEKNGWFVIKYDVKNAQVEVYNTKGYEYENKIMYSLNEIENFQI